MGMRLWKKFICLCFAIGFPVFLTGCPIVAQKKESQGKVYYTFFDTVSTIYSYAGDDEGTFEENAAAAEDLLEAYHRRLDIYHEYSGMNNLCTVNKGAGGEAVEVDRETMDFLIYARELCEETGGTLNIMFGAVLRPWHDSRERAANDPGSAAIPSRDTLEEAVAHTGLELLELDEEACTVRITDPDARLDVGAIGKGYATEQAARLLEDMGAESYVLNIGGNIRIIGHKPDGSGWMTGIKDPFDHESAYAMYLELADTSCVTSGVYERYFEVAGERYHHIIDPDTLTPARYFASVSVITKDSGLADALSTALFCMPQAEGQAFIDGLDDDVQVLWIALDGSQMYTDGIHPIDRDQDTK